MAEVPPGAKSMTAPPRTKKAARAQGYINYFEAVGIGRIPKRNAQPLIVKDEEFFSVEDCEALVGSRHMSAKGLSPDPDAEPVAFQRPMDLPIRLAHGAVYRESDMLPLPKRREVLDAIRRVSLDVPRWRQPAWEDSTETPLSLVEKGIDYAWSQGYLMFIGRTSQVALYSDGHYPGCQLSSAEIQETGYCEY